MAVASADGYQETESLTTTLVGRDAELARIHELLERARLSSESATLVVRGPAGAGKSALLEEARALADGMNVLAIAGVESEAELPFAGLHQLFLPILDRIRHLPSVQAKALSAALGLSGGIEERFLVSIAALGLLADAAEEQPLVCIVDDAHWLDDATADALVFVARRLRAEGIVLLFAARDEEWRHFDAPALPDLRLDGLSPEAARELLDRHSHGLATVVRERLVDTTEGNPLALLELASSLSDAELEGRVPLGTPPPVSWEVERAFLSRIRALPRATQTLLLIAAADDTGDIPTILDAAARLEIPPDSLDAAERADLVRVRDRQLQVRHPLIRSATYHGAPASARRAVHAALAEVSSAAADPDRRAWHRAAAAVGPDAEVVAELEDAANRARRRGAFAAASVALERAAALTPDDDRRAGQLAAAGDNAWLAGQEEQARLLLNRAHMLASGPLLRADIDRTRGVIALNTGMPGEAFELLLAAGVEVAEFDGRRALQLLSLASLAATHASDPDAIVAIGDVAARIHADETSPAALLLSNHLRGLGAYYAGDFQTAAPRLRAALELAGAADTEASSDVVGVLVIASAVGLFLGDDHAVHELHRRMAARARESGALGHLTFALPRLAVSDIWAGQLLSATARLTEALDLARAIGQHVIASFVLAELAIVAALRGDEDACRSYAEQAFELASPRRLVYIEYITNSAIVALELGLGRAEEAIQRSQRFKPTRGLDFWDALDRIEAAVRAGEADIARESVEVFESWANASGATWARAVSLHCRALLTDDAEQAEELFLRALEMHSHASRPFEAARTEFAFGEFLRRARRRREARSHLRAALEIFERLGAKLWAERARVELRASGMTARKRDPSTIDDLTPQEVQIAQRVAQGLSNREVAEELFLSQRTIEFHLRKVFRKLGITSRMELTHIDFDARA